MMKNIIALIGLAVGMLALGAVPADLKLPTPEISRAARVRCKEVTSSLVPKALHVSAEEAAAMTARNEAERMQDITLLGDGTHPNAAGYRVWADAVSPFYGNSRHCRIGDAEIGFRIGLQGSDVTPWVSVAEREFVRRHPCGNS